jgi:hypothetical protein
MRLIVDQSLYNVKERSRAIMSKDRSSAPAARKLSHARVSMRLTPTTSGLDCLFITPPIDEPPAAKAGPVDFSLATDAGEHP